TNAANTNSAQAIDNVAPTQTIGGLSLSSDSGTAGDFITNVASQTISATLNAPLASGDQLWGSLDGGSTWTNITTKVSGTSLSWNSVTLSASNDIEIEVRDAAGNPGTQAIKAYVLDTKAPTATIVLGDSTLKVGSTTTVTVTFSEAVSNFSNADLTLQNGSLTTMSSANGGITWTGTFTPTANIEDTSNVITLGTAYNDVAGNTGTIASSDNYTVDTKAPTLSSSTPADSASNVSTSSNVTLTFSENIYAGSGTITIKNSSGSTFATFDVANATTTTNPSNGNIGISGNSIYLNPNNSFSNNTTYYISIASTAVEDAAGNPYAGIVTTSSAGLDFRTPIALDLDGNGVAYISKSAGVTYDYNHDGLAESTAWVAANDGLLAMQNENGSLNIVFSTQVGETDLQGLAKLYDSNQDGVLNSQDTNFAKFGVWQDLNSDGKVDAGEFQSLDNRNIVSLSLSSDGQVQMGINGDVIIFGDTTYTTADGKEYLAQDVAFGSSSNNELADFSALLSGAESVHSMISIDQDPATDSSSSLFIELGGQTYEIATLKGEELGGKDILSHFVGADAAKGIDSNAWTEVVDIASIHGGPASISADGGILANGYENKAGDWTVIVKSGTATVDAESKQIVFSSDSAENAVTIVTADGASHDIQHVDKVQWHG
ncbi:MAG: Ig-like domain-containing protein, partial [Polynucleobacter sp.]|nr:Ig-like domain-containing protein [Polynucleobacter sp.]